MPCSNTSSLTYGVRTELWTSGYYSCSNRSDDSSFSTTVHVPIRPRICVPRPCTQLQRPDRMPLLPGYVIAVCSFIAILTPHIGLVESGVFPACFYLIAMYVMPPHCKAVKLMLTRGHPGGTNAQKHRNATRSSSHLRLSRVVSAVCSPVPSARWTACEATAAGDGSSSSVRASLFKLHRRSG